MLGRENAHSAFSSVTRSREISSGNGPISFVFNRRSCCIARRPRRRLSHMRATAVVDRDAVLRVIGANPEHDRVEALEIFRGDSRRHQASSLDSRSVEALRNLIARSGNITDQLALLPNVCAHQSSLLLVASTYERQCADMRCCSRANENSVRLIRTIAAHCVLHSLFDGGWTVKFGEGLAFADFRSTAIDVGLPPSIRHIEAKLPIDCASRGASRTRDRLRFLIAEHKSGFDRFAKTGGAMTSRLLHFADDRIDACGISCRWSSADPDRQFAASLPDGKGGGFSGEPNQLLIVDCKRAERRRFAQPIRLRIR